MNLGGTFNHAGGTILASGNDGSGTNSTVNLAGTAASTINGGTLTTTGGGVMTSSGSTLNGVTISSGSTVTNTNGGSTTLQGTITLSGPTATLAEAATVNNTDLHIGGAVTLTGGGSLTMSGSSANRFLGTGSDTLLNDTSNTIQGSGQIGINNSGFAFTLTNKGTIDANLSSASNAALQIAPTNAVTNSGLLEATAGVHASIWIGTFNNTATGTILVDGYRAPW